MPETMLKFWESPLFGSVFALGAAVWAAFQSGDLSRYTTLPMAVFLLALGQVIYALIHERNELRSELQDKRVRLGIAKRLGKLLNDSQGLQTLDGVHPQHIIDDFDRRVEAYLTEEPILGVDYLARYRSGAGITITIPVGLSPEHQIQWCHMHTKRARLGEFIREMRGD